MFEPTTTDGTGWDDPEMQAGLAFIVRALTEQGEVAQRAMADRVARDLLPEVRDRVVELVVGQLRSTVPDRRNRAVAALLAIGLPALPTVLSYFRRRTRPTVLVILAGVVARVGQLIQPASRMSVQVNLMFALRFTGDVGAARAIARALVCLRSDAGVPGQENPGLVELVLTFGAPQLYGDRSRSAEATDPTRHPGAEQSALPPPVRDPSSVRPPRRKRRKGSGRRDEPTINDES